MLNILVILVLVMAPYSYAEDESLWDKTKTASKSAWGDTKEISGEALEKTKESSQQLWGETKNTSAKVWDKTKSASNNTAKEVKESSTDYWADIKAWWNDL